MIKYCVIKTRLGWCAVVGDKQRIKQVILPALQKRKVLNSVFSRYPGIRQSEKPFKGFVRNIQDYLDGKRFKFDFPIDLSGFSRFEKSVYRAVQTIPASEVRPYCWVGRQVGKLRAARAVGNALAKNPVPLIVPCHRVVRSDNTLGKFSADGGTRLKRTLLRIEGALK